MKNNQFAIIKRTHQQKINELTTIGFLTGEPTINVTSLWNQFLTLSFPETTDEETMQTNLENLLATPTKNLLQFILDDEPITTDIFYLVALQLLQFEPDVDFDLQHPLAAMETIQLPFLTATTWNESQLIDAWYLLLNTHTKNGQTYLDLLTARGFLTPLYALPAKQKPIFFNGKALAVFDPVQLIREVVYVEAPLDTDNDGQADLLKVEILRPSDTNEGLKVPTVYTASPYNQGTNDEWGTKATHDVRVPIKHKTGQPDMNTTENFNQEFTTKHPSKEARTATETFTREASYTLNDYLAVRGFAVAYAAGIGTKDSDGIQTCGSPEQTIATIAVIEWLTGKRKAYTTRKGTTEIKAWWSNAKVGMTGRSYLGTLATAAATTGVEGLKTIISEAAISSWYDYYRENGLVIAPGGFQGEDADVLAAETMSRTKNPADYQQIKTYFNDYLTKMQSDMDRITGNYNGFWAQRNYRPDIKNINADIMMVQGLNDWNVKPNQVKALWDALSSVNVDRKLILHQGEHIYINAFRSIDYTDIVNLWLSNKLYDVDNDASQLPDLIVQDNVTPETWNTYADWEENQPTELFTIGEQGLGTEKLTTSATVSFVDKCPNAEFEKFSKEPNNWQTDLAQPNDILQIHDPAKLRFMTVPLREDLLLRGTPTLKLSVSSSIDHGLISAQLIDFGLQKRFNISPTMLQKKGLQLGHQWREDDLREFTLAAKETDFKMISFGHINLQNRISPAQVDELIPNQLVDLQFDLQPIFHHIPAGHLIGLIVFGTDFSMTQLDNSEAIKYTIETNESSLIIPSVAPYSAES